jgi:glutamate carboxypeptidase
MSNAVEGGLPSSHPVNLDDLLSDLEGLVTVESPSSDASAIRRSAAALADLIERRLGTAAQLIEGPRGPHVHWRGGDASKVLILGHHDTVHPLGALAERPFTVVDGIATGPGVFDMKAGIVQAVHAVAGLVSTNGVEMLFSCDEEVGSGTSRALIEERAVACGAVLVLEPSADGGALKTGRKGTGTFEVLVTGRAAHAGLEPEKGDNALIEAAHQILEIATFGDPAQGTTVTPTMARAGTADNVVPDEARISVDVRVTGPGEKQRIEAAMASLMAQDPRCQVIVTGKIARPPMPESASTDLFAIAREVDAAIEGVSVGGGSDGNFTAAVGVPTLDGLGAVGGGAHTPDEHVQVNAMVPRVDLLRGILTRVLARA